ncbi:DUF5412 family protein [Gottfriedia sp. NPDC057948]|uniref:DUF5412 family protein n=1 Tax=Gottfriedia sp. NPDC057948 TaxID=3346287 RepID=UPI0036DC7CF4
MDFIGFFECLLYAPPTLSYLPKGELIGQSKSPNQEYTLKAYVSSGEQQQISVRGELSFNKKAINPINTGIIMKRKQI